MQVNGLPADITQRLPGIGRTAGTQPGVSERSFLADSVSSQRGQAADLRVGIFGGQSQFTANPA
jgi:hypothetical protein